MSTVAAPFDSPAHVPRLWPAAALVALYWTGYAAIGLADMSNFHVFFARVYLLGGVALAYLAWWLACRRAPWPQRWAVVGVFVAAAAASFALLDHSLDRLQLGVVIWALPLMLTLWTLWLYASRRARPRTATLGMACLAVASWAWGPAVRMDGLTGAGGVRFAPRWTPSGEERFLAARAEKNAAAPSDADAQPLTAGPGDWTGFRGERRDGVVRGAEFDLAWSERPPRQLWKRRVGPGWSSVVVVGQRVFTQEQRGQREAVVCYDADDGAELWVHEDDARFEETMGGVGPRATPTFDAGRLYALGANGMLNCLDAATGARVWSQDVSRTGQTADGSPKVPMWGYCSSPLVVDGRVIVFAGGGGRYAGEKPAEAGQSSGASNDGAPAEDQAAAADAHAAADGKAPADSKTASAANPETLLAYDAATGELAWRAPGGGHSYSSAQLVELDGVTQVAFPGDDALRGYDPATGAEQWSVAANSDESLPSIQPHALDDGRLLASFNAQAGLVAATVAHDDGWRAETQWTTRDMKPFFNDFVRAGDTLYGFDGDIFCAVDAATGKRRWKKGRYGSGQVVLIADQSALVVVSESGEAVALAATPERHRELGRFAAIEGKTWNHPAIAQGRLYVRNAEEMACYELAPRP